MEKSARSREGTVSKVEAKMEKLVNAVLKTRQKMARLLELVAREKENKKKGRQTNNIT
ncbi:MAG: hypothetical protein JNM63_07785 [Spirochaetia bacterium]|nr:hypothetical protein [Spirochaetia bacterium]